MADERNTVKDAIISVWLGDIRHYHEFRAGFGTEKLLKLFNLGLSTHATAHSISSLKSLKDHMGSYESRSTSHLANSYN